MALETLWKWHWAGSSLFNIEMLEKLLNLFHVVIQKTSPINVRMDGSTLKEKLSFKILIGLSCQNWIEVLALSVTKTIGTRNNSLKTWAIKLQFLLIYKNMLKSVAMARSQCITKHENKVSYNKDFIVLALNDDRKDIRTQIAKIIVLTKNWFLVFFMNFLSTVWKNNVLAICISY